MLLLTLCCVPALVGAATPEELVDEGHVRLRVQTEPARQVVLGQQTKILVDILTDTWFTKAPQYPELSIDGAVALMPEQLGTNFTERIDGTTFAAQRRGYVVYPQRAGALEVPPIPIRLGVAVDGEPSDLFTLTTPALKLQVVLPPAAEAVGRFVTTPNLEVEETWDRSLEALRVGDALKRTVGIEADDALGMFLPVLEFEAPSGIALYHDQPRVTDRVNRGQYRGERVEAVTYVLQRAGEFALPELQIHWWNTRTGTLETELLEARTISVAESDQSEAVLVAPRRRELDWRGRLAGGLDWLRDHASPLLAAGFVLTVGLIALRRHGRAVLAGAQRRFRERRESESARFRALERETRSGNEAAVVRSYWSWRSQLQAELPDLGTLRLRAIAADCGFREVWGRFERARYGSGQAGDWDRSALRRSLGRFRAAIRAAALPRRDRPSLNPRGRVE